MGKNNTVKKFQTARLDEWIGDYKSADLIYEEIQQSGDKLSYILESTIKERKKKLPLNKETQTDLFYGYVAEYRKRIDDSTKRLYQLESLQPRRIHEKRIQNDLMKWKYSVSVISKADNDLRMEIRGYNPEGNVPKLNTELPQKMIGWEIESDIQFSETVAILIEINAYNEEESTKMYLNIDQWGLLSGTIIVDEKNLGDTLLSIHMFLNCLSNKFW